MCWRHPAGVFLALGPGQRTRLPVAGTGKPNNCAAIRLSAFGKSVNSEDRHPHFLPPYAPDLNPDEFVWSYMKNNGVSKKPLKKNESLRKRVEEDLTKIQSNPQLVRSFFGADSVAYTND